MQVSHVTQNVVQILVALFEKYEDRDVLASDYLDSSLSRYPGLKENELVCLIELFLGLHRHEQFLCRVVDYVYCLTKRTDHHDRVHLLVINYLLLFALDRGTFGKVKEIIVEFSVKKGKQLLQVYNKTGFVDDLVEAGCAYFDYEYVTDKILQVFLTDKTIFKDLLDEINTHIKENAKVMWHPTVPVTPRQLKYNKKIPLPPCNSLEELTEFRHEPVPVSTYRVPKISEKIELEKCKNRAASIQHYNEAQLNATALQKHPPHYCLPEPEVKPCKVRQNPKFLEPEVPVKTNTTVLLREAARVIKEEEKEIKKIEKLEAGGSNYTKYERLLEDLRKEEEQTHLQEIERKHLQGLLTREEAIIAKHRLAKENKQRRAKQEEEKQELMKYLNQMRENEEEKIRNTVGKVKMIQKNIEVKKNSLQKLKNKTAQEVSDVTKKMFEEAVKKRKEELNKRIALMEEIKALSNLRDLRRAEFDPSETMNLGLMCEMSLAELQERLVILRIDFKEDLERRRRRIQQSRFKQQKFLTETKDFLQLHRAYKKQMVREEREKKKKQSVNDNEEISVLREKLEKAKKMKNQIKSEKVPN